MSVAADVNTADAAPTLRKRPPSARLMAIERLQTITSQVWRTKLNKTFAGMVIKFFQRSDAAFPTR